MLTLLSDGDANGIITAHIQFHYVLLHLISVAIQMGGGQGRCLCLDIFSVLFCFLDSLDYHIWRNEIRTIV